MRVPGLQRARRAASGLARRLRRDAVVLLYHRVADASSDPHRLCVSPSNFEEQLAVARRERTPVPLRLIVRRLAEGRSVRGLLAVTFDDGYADNLLVAAAILERQAVPATLFAVSGMIGAAGEFWWDELERILLDTPDPPPTLELSIGGERRRWRRDAGHYGRAHGARADAASATSCLAPVALRTLAAHMEAAPAAEKTRVLAALRAWCGGERPARRSHRCLTHAELRAFDRHALFDVGAHTASHPVLPLCDAATRRREIGVCKAELEAVLDHAVDGLSYPHGRHDEATRACVATSGYAYACCSERSAVRATSDRFAIPRREASDHDGARFARWLSA